MLYEVITDLKVVRIPEIISELQQSYDFVVVDLGRSLSRISQEIITAYEQNDFKGFFDRADAIQETLERVERAIKKEVRFEIARNNFV